MFWGVPGDSDSFWQVCQESANLRGAPGKQGNYSPRSRLQGCARNAQILVSPMKRRLEWNKLAMWARAVTI